MQRFITRTLIVIVLPACVIATFAETLFRDSCRAWRYAYLHARDEIEIAAILWRNAGGNRR
jgi:hypothetical protein